MVSGLYTHNNIKLSYSVHGITYLFLIIQTHPLVVHFDEAGAGFITIFPDMFLCRGGGGGFFWAWLGWVLRCKTTSIGKRAKRPRDSRPTLVGRRG
jgi:hypothetical protein